MRKTAAVIGAGAGGLAVANLLAKIGYSVTVYEQHAQPGGRTGQLCAKGFTFDTGPSWYLMPDVFEHYFSLLGKKATDYYQLQKLEPAYKVFFDYHNPLTINGNLGTDIHTFDSIEPGAGKHLAQYVATSERVYKTALQNYLYNPKSLVHTALQKSTLHDAPLMVKLLTRSLHAHVTKTVSSLPLQQILEYPMVFLGASPFNTPSLYQLMSFLDFKQGVYYPMGGMYKIVESLQASGRELGVSYEYNASVEEIPVKNGRAQGVEVNGMMKAADIVISNADLHFTETQLLEPTYQTYPEPYWLRKVSGPSALLMYLGVKGKLPQLEHHNLLFVKAWRHNFDAIFTNKHWPEHASMYVSRSSAHDVTVAPIDSENIFILVPVPAGYDQPSDLRAAADHYLREFENMTGITDFTKRITYRSFRSTSHFAEAFHSWQGSALGMAHLLKQSAFWRPNSRSRKVHNLYYIGGGVQPGIGLPMCLISAELAIKHLVGDYSAGPLPGLEFVHA